MSFGCCERSLSAIINLFRAFHLYCVLLPPFCPFAKNKLSFYGRRMMGNGIAHMSRGIVSPEWHALRFSRTTEHFTYHLTGCQFYRPQFTILTSACIVLSFTLVVVFCWKIKFSSMFILKAFTAVCFLREEHLPLCCRFWTSTTVRNVVAPFSHMGVCPVEVYIHTV